MKRIIFFFLVLIFSLKILDAQVAQQWVYRYNGPGNGFDGEQDFIYGKYIIADKTGNVYSLGSSAGIGTGNDYVILKFNSNGALIWEKRYNGPGNATDNPYYITLDNSGFLCITGTSTSATNGDIATLKLDTNGNQIWLARYNNAANNANEIPYSMATDNSGNVYVTGLCAGISSNDYITIKYDLNGNQLWAVTYNGTGNGNDYAYSIRVDNSGNVYVTGWSDGSGTSVDYATVKYDASGNQLWTQRYNGPGNALDIANELVLDNLGNLYVTGSSNGSGTGDDCTTLKYSNSGSLIWERRFAGPTTSSDHGWNIAINSDNDLFVAGMTGSQTLTIKYDTSGNQIWSQIYAPSYGGNQGGTGLSADNQGNAYVIGWANESNPSLRDLYCLKYDLIGNLSWSTVYNTPGGNTFDEVKDIFVDVYGNVYLAGQIAVSGNFDINILKYHQVPFPPTLISPFHNSLSQPTTLNLIWRKTSGTSYRVQVATDAGFSNLIVNDSTVTDTTKSVSGLNSNTTYYWRVNAKNAVGTSGYSSAWQFTTMPPVSASPNPISPPNNSANQPLSLTMVWSKPQFAATYRVQLATDAGFSNLIVNDSTITDTTKSVSGLNNNTTYYWRVNAKNAAGTSGYSSVWQFTTIPPVPASPNPLLPPDNSVNQPLSLNLVWSKPQFAVTYRLQVSTDAGFSNIIVNDSTLTDTTKNISALSNLTGYWWRVNAKNIAGTSGFSTAFKFTTIIAAPTAPVLFSPLNNQTGLLLSLNLVWLKRPTAQTYRVQLASDSLFTSIIVNDSTLTDSIKSVAGLQPLTNYWWRVNAKNVGGTSSYSPAWKFRTLGSPYQVELLSPPDSAVNQPVNITFRWAIANDQTDRAPFVKNTFFGAESIQKYWFELNLDTLGASVVIDSNLVDSFKTVNSLVNQTRYYWRVKAKNEIGWGGFSRWFRFNTIIQNPTIPLQFSPQDNAINIPLNMQMIWYRLPSATHYHVMLARDSVFTQMVVDDSLVTDSVRNVSGLNPLTVYYWKVRAKNVGGYSQFSQTWNFTTVPVPPAAPNLVSPLDGTQGLSLTPVLDWDSISTATGYQVQVARDTGFTSIAYDSTEITTSGIMVPAGSLQNDSAYYWRVRSYNPGGYSVWSEVWSFRIAPIGLTQITNIIPKEFKLYNNYPNPFNPVTKIKVDIPKTAITRLIVYDILGREVITLIDQQLQPGVYLVDWDASYVSSGVYFYRLNAGNYTNVKRMILVK